MVTLTVPHHHIRTPNTRELRAAAACLLVVLFTVVALAAATTILTTSPASGRAPLPPQPSDHSRLVPTPRPQSRPTPVGAHDAGSVAAGRS